ncbi:CDP-glucose 4,6-dehydratase (plasmid) [Legionella adelaidensis]|uniref:CDP-glucose 4,6-dehydratase n=1 Tax=Legionella adelaidensis TaxID=45056 RepID=A0A0W0R4S0_9GAMM|nr:CDP-glucose 4,6-dehydratase [Legionella adelaidensis]KTC66061.1 CDP-glucose 4,6-dehydratase [Legionella adelaidensis]VEH85721.1 CDP-glucose 4,6-dehydratase [Legionella adelaidensis]
MKFSFWQNKKVLITGHTGFKGSWLSLWLQRLGAEVVGFSLNPPTEPNLFTLANIAKRMTSLLGNIRDFNSLKSVICEFEPEIIFHMAAQPLVGYSYENPVETYSTNVMGTVNLLEAARHSRQFKVIVNVTSDKCYENNEEQKPFQESDRLGGHDPYSNSKGCAELVTHAFQKSYFSSPESLVRLASVRAGNVIGGGDWAEKRLIPDIVRSFLLNTTLNIRSPNALRPWQHVLESLNGYLHLAEALFTSEEYAQAWNFGPNREDAKPVGWIIEKMQELWGRRLSINYQDAEFQEAYFLTLDSTKSKNKLNWTPHWNLETALVKTVEWYRAFENREDLYTKTCLQIEEYQNEHFQ